MLIRERQASVFVPPMFILRVNTIVIGSYAHEPQIPSLQERRKVNVESCSFWTLVGFAKKNEGGLFTLILISASRTIGPQAFKSTWYFCIVGFTVGVSGFYPYQFDYLDQIPYPSINRECFHSRLFRMNRRSTSRG